MNITNNDWDDILQDEYNKDYFKSLMNILDYEYAHEEIYPPRDEIFNALRLTSYNDTKIVIVGQDPYIGPGQAHGLSFSVKPDKIIPPSLLNIYKELQNDCNCYIPNHGCLIEWAQQGVLLLNSVLTVRNGKSRSHYNIGWEIFTDKIIRLLNDDKLLYNDKGSRSRIFMLWGNNAKRKAECVDTNTHLVLKAAHPSPLAGGAFFGCKHFSKANEYLYEIGKEPINWQISNIKKENIK